MLLWSRPRWRFGDFAAAGKVTRRPQAAKPPCVNDTPKTARRGRGPGQLLLPLRGNLPSRALQGAETSTGGRMAPLRREGGSFRSGRLIAALQSGWQPAPSSASHSLGTFPPKGKAFGRPQGSPLRRIQHQYRWFGKARRRI